MHIARNLRILFQNPLGSVDDHEDNPRTVDRAQGAHHAVPLHRQSDLSLAPHPCRINEKILCTVFGKMCVNRIAGRPRHITDDDPLLTEQTIHERGFADIGTANDGNSDLIRLLCLRRLCWERCDDGIQQIAEIHRIGGRDGNRVTEPKRIEIVNQCFTLKAIDLVDRQNHRFFRPPQKPRDLLIRSCQSCPPIDEKEDDICLLHCQLCLRTHRTQDMVALIELDAAGVNDRKLMVQPLRIQIDAVTRHARHIVDNGDTLLADLIEQCRLPDIGASDHGHNGFAHDDSLLSLHPQRFPATGFV